jgi:hypothetical protein
MKKQTICRVELDRAVDAFMRSGGLVVQLVPEKTRINRRVGQRWGQYEEVLATAGALVEDPAAGQSMPA